MRFIDGAMECVERGWSVFPLSPGSKLPAMPKTRGGRGVLDATRDVAKIQEWARQWPRANVGLACGRSSGLSVIDIDPKSGGMESVAALKARGFALVPTLSVRTPSGGWHLYYEFEPLLTNSKSKLGQGIDVRTEGGYVVAPPSRLFNGRGYSWYEAPASGELPHRMPRWAVQMLKPADNAVFTRNESARDANRAIQGLVEQVRRAKGGERNSWLYWAAMRAFENGWTDQGTQMTLAAAAGAAGLSLKEAMKTIGSALKRTTGGRVGV